MIRQIRGEIVEVEAGHVVIDVNGVGYIVFTKGPIVDKGLGEELKLHTYLAVRETAMDLYGFVNRDELDIFKMLIDLPKIGPKSALQILGQADIPLLKEAVINNDPQYLSKLSGIGKKSAEKIVAGLKDKMDEWAEADIGAVRSESGAVHTTDTIDALVALGYSQQEARKVVLEINTTNPEITDSSTALTLALKLLNK